VTGREAAVAVVTSVLLLTGLTALAGCGSSGGHKTASAPAAPHATAERPAASAPGIGPDGTAEPGPAAGDGRTVPKAQLTPATGTFTDPEKDYLVGKVPYGMDPAAVLQTGQNSCERVANTAGENPAAVRRAIKDGEIAYARDAITYLCPSYRGLLS
jgi:hypothetical protein